MLNKNRILFASLVIALTSCTTDEQAEQIVTPQPIHLGSVEYGEWSQSATRASSYGDIVYVSAGGAAATAYMKDGDKYKVSSGMPQEWTAPSMEVFGFVRDDGVSALRTNYQIPLTQSTSTECYFFASNKTNQFYSSSAGGGISISMKQRLAMLKVTVSDAVVGTTQLAVGGGNLRCRGMFSYDAGDAGSWNTSIAEPTTITVTKCDEGKVFTVYILPQTAASDSRFFAVSSSANHVAYYALPSETVFEEGKIYTCTLIQDMTVASISIDPDFSNGSENVETTTGSN